MPRVPVLLSGYSPRRQCKNRHLNRCTTQMRAASQSRSIGLNGTRVHSSFGESNILAWLITLAVINLYGRHVLRFRQQGRAHARRSPQPSRDLALEGNLQSTQEAFRAAIAPEYTTQQNQNKVASRNFQKALNRAANVCFADGESQAFALDVRPNVRTQGAPLMMIPPSAAKFPCISYRASLL
jgi:hypothetical protein